MKQRPIVTPRPFGSLVTLTTLTTVTLAGLGACGGIVSGVALDGGTASDGGTVSTGSLSDGGPSDGAIPGDAAGGNGDGGGGATTVQCGSTPCSGGSVCCIAFADGGATSSCAASCPGDAGTLACDGPEGCSSSSPICCANLTLGPGSLPKCPATGVRARCAATCPTSIAPSCGVTDQVRLCHTSADCAGEPQGYTTCCSLGSGTGAGAFCVNGALAGFAQKCF